ncbi:uncharacterized protein LOC141600172 isoform X1 [Silene latifolia]|uniref:uncharacterized protein LOC141600172 isoform X1 n=1 Tax=Silene latifolia TaxID=37657 RepID=UPI003D78475E
MQSVAFTAAPFFIVAAAWFIIFGLSLICTCLYFCCCRSAPYGYSRVCYALSLILILFTIAAIWLIYNVKTHQNMDLYFVRLKGSQSNFESAECEEVVESKKNMGKEWSYLTSFRHLQGYCSLSSRLFNDWSRRGCHVIYVFFYYCDRALLT